MLRFLGSCLKSRHPSLLPHTRRAAVAIIFRELQEKNTEILFIKRAYKKTDRWSGHVAFPGGRHQAKETDFETAVRETKEEIGIDLSSSTFDYLGRLDDQHVHGNSAADSLALSAFVFAQNTKKPPPPPFVLDAKEVDDVQWVKFERVDKKFVEYNVQYTYRGINALLPSINLIVDHSVAFPANGKEKSKNNNKKEQTATATATTIVHASSLSTPPPVSSSSSPVSSSYQLWGLTLKTCSLLLKTLEEGHKGDAGQEGIRLVFDANRFAPLDHPPLKLQWAVLNAIARFIFHVEDLYRKRQLVKYTSKNPLDHHQRMPRRVPRSSRIESRLFLWGMGGLVVSTALAILFAAKF